MPWPLLEHHRSQSVLYKIIWGSNIVESTMPLLLTTAQAHLVYLTSGSRKKLVPKAEKESPMMRGMEWKEPPFLGRLTENQVK